ncbi:hypothetical protein J0383_13105 [Flavobacterium endoglycinae]|uniref:DUF4476 domain-containing protein n=1 Tax=Flavobacterium endoglycinae TaxID=2816357 RepID=A0ABX7Q8Z8_9FLAO|nr:hypothetical protein [Flavobacterium endoglycinae]QSW87235.1 hypothetical protein J0383_13105 [Flavobacterium endoglycinae]
MKKKLEAELISIAHRILKLKNKSDINQLYLETQKLYEKLAVLKFVEENFDTQKPTIGQSEINSELETIFNKEEEITPVQIQSETPAEEVIALEESYEAENTEEVTAEEITEPVAEKTEESIAEEKTESIIPETTEPVLEKAEEPIAEEKLEFVVPEIIEPIFEKIEEPAAVIPDPVQEIQKEIEIPEEPKNTSDELSFTTVSDLKPIPDFKPAFELDQEEIQEVAKEEPKTEEKTEPKASPIPIAFEDFGINYADAQFVKVDSFEPISSNDSKEKKTIETTLFETVKEPVKPVSLNEKLARGFHIDLNDRIAFTKNLFGNSTEDYSRVLNQLLTFDSFAEVKDFIENMVKPDYNNWEGKDDYAERFLGIIEKKFS